MEEDTTFLAKTLRLFLCGLGGFFFFITPQTHVWMIQIIIRILKQNNFSKSLIFETPVTGKYMFCLHYIPYPPVVGYGSKNVKIMVFWNIMWSNFGSNILEDLAAFICCLSFPADGGSRFSLKYCLLSTKLNNIKIEIWIICCSCCAYSYIHYINLQVCSIKYNANHKIHFMTSIKLLHVLAPQCHPQGIVYFLRKWVICIVSEPSSFSLWQGCSSIWSSVCLLLFDISKCSLSNYKSPYCD